MIALKTRLKDLEGKLETMTNLERTSSSVENLEMIHLKAQMKDLEKKLDIVADAVCKLVEQFEGSAGDENKKRKTNLQKSSSINSDQESGISKSRI
ncbi:unnamed protein product [Microthlaspi erraticum]|uniref:Uncharacterized protein n=1 Tax=Microthlaspi erraticum TaxID=1685480 RepID=A0A6D2L3F0_9BRAS|nr:unnamed protein product [Microthlaspi erraticum]